MEKSKAVIVFGGAGFIGYNFVKYLQENTDVKPIVIDKMTYAAINAPRLTCLRFEADIARGWNGIADSLVEEFDLLGAVNFAAESHVDRSIVGAKEFIDSNILGAHNVALECKRLNLPLLHISTDEVYGDTDFSSKHEFTVDSSLHPSNPYAASKAAADLMLEALGRTHGLNYKIIRMTNNYGPYQHGEKFLPTVIRNIIQGTKIPVYGKGMNIREWLYVDDAVRGIWRVFIHGKNRKIYNLGDDENRKSNIKMIKTIIEIMSRQSFKPVRKCAETAAFEFVPDRPGHDRRYALKSSPTNELFRLKNDIIIYTPLEDGLLKTIQFYWRELQPKN